MATFFGEVILPSSRVFFDNDDSDFEDDDVLQSSNTCNLLELKELLPNALTGDFDLLIIAEGNVAKGFTDNYLLESPGMPIAEINLKQDETKEPMDIMEVKPPKTQPSYIYSLDLHTRLVIVSPAINLTLANNLLITDFIQKSKSVFVLCNRPSADFRCDSINDLPPAFIRMLNTSNSDLEGIPPCQILEQPNFISGFAASVISWCECTRKNCKLYIVYTDRAVVDSVTLKPFVDLFTKQNRLKGLLTHTLAARLSTSSEQCFMYM
ncbi:proteasome assembly chaperone 1 isoform X2 [Cimex lectularius]|uniref:Proteasome assembly chaperone 1 n=1 Tax=Cimex lectularius TaxID=79782 RepID=A0A8I6TII4_CIMLE|nr:proteasome assembly chaperone 1 isoform X2 [Cimex lectularius]